MAHSSSLLVVVEKIKGNKVFFPSGSVKLSSQWTSLGVLQYHYVYKIFFFIIIMFIRFFLQYLQLIIWWKPPWSLSLEDFSLFREIQVLYACTYCVSNILYHQFNSINFFTLSLQIFYIINNNIIKYML